jgi:hypothetical protein
MLGGCVRAWPECSPDLPRVGFIAIDRDPDYAPGADFKDLRRIQYFWELIRQTHGGVQGQLVHFGLLDTWPDRAIYGKGKDGIRPDQENVAPFSIPRRRYPFSR